MTLSSGTDHDRRFVEDRDEVVTVSGLLGYIAAGDLDGVSLGGREEGREAGAGCGEEGLA